MEEPSTRADAPVVEETAAETASGELEEGEVPEVAGAAEAAMAAVEQGVGAHTVETEHTRATTSQVGVERSADEPPPKEDAVAADVAAPAEAAAAGTPARGTGRRKRGGAVAAKPNKTMLSFGDELEVAEDGDWGKMAGE